MLDRLGELLAERAATVPASTLAWAAIDGDHVISGRCGGGAGADQPRFFAVGSITKAFTGTLLARLEQRGLVRADTRLGDVLSDLRLRSEVAAITLGALQAHTSGLPRLPANLQPVDPADPYAGYGRDALFALLETTSNGQIIDGRGKREYSNLGGGLLGTLLAIAAGAAYDELLDTHIFGPLGMHDSFVASAARLAQRAPGLSGYDADGEPRPAWSFDCLAPAGGIVSTIPDLVRFARALLDDERWAAASNASWVQTGRIRWHNGRTASHHAMLAFDLERRRAAIALWNAAADLDDICLHVLDPAHAPRGPQPTLHLPAETLHAYAGTYASGTTVLRVAAHDGRLSIAAKLFGGWYYAAGDDRFVSKTAPMFALRFVRDDGGMVTTVEVFMHAVKFLTAHAERA